VWNTLILLGMGPEGVSTNSFFSVRGKNNFDQPGAAKGTLSRKRRAGLPVLSRPKNPRCPLLRHAVPFCALRRHILAGQVFFKSKNLTANPFKTSFERRIEALF
jgi:hypothetical protein